MLVSLSLQRWNESCSMWEQKRTHKQHPHLQIQIISAEKKYLSKKSQIKSICLYSYSIYKKKQSPEVFCKKVVLRNFAKFRKNSGIGKCLYQSFFFNKVAGLRLSIKMTFCNQNDFGMKFGPSTKYDKMNLITLKRTWQ